MLIRWSLVSLFIAAITISAILWTRSTIEIFGTSFCGCYPRQFLISNAFRNRGSFQSRQLAGWLLCWMHILEARLEPWAERYLASPDHCSVCHPHYFCCKLRAKSQMISDDGGRYAASARGP